MKVTNSRQELKALSKEDLREKIEHLRKDLFTLRLNSSTTHVKNYSQFKVLRRTISRALTYLQQK